MTLNPQDILKLLLAVTAGGLIGIEREYHDKAAGFRTLIFIEAGLRIQNHSQVKSGDVVTLT